MATLDLDLGAARRLAVGAQLLAGPPVRADGLKTVLRALRCLQLDPIGAVAPSHLLVLWSRLGDFDRAALESLLWRERWLFEYWAHAASIVLTEDYALHAATMRRYPGPSAYGRRVRDWLGANEKLREHILDRLAVGSPLPAGAFEDMAEVPWESTGWTAGRNVERMLDHLLLLGRVTVTARSGRKRLWCLTEQHFPAEVIDHGVPETVVVPTAVEYALRALGVARARDIRRHFTRDRYPGLDRVLRALVASGRVVPARVQGDPEPGYVHADSLPLLEAQQCQPRTVLLSPFDNLICDRDRTLRLWGFAFRNEMYQPVAKRAYGYYVMPVLHGERLVGRAALRVDRRRRALTVEGLFAEPGAPADEAFRTALRCSLEELARFSGADSVVRAGPVAEEWTSAVPA
jgi:uncharacterized protein YcaQ